MKKWLTALTTFLVVAVVLPAFIVVALGALTGGNVGGLELIVFGGPCLVLGLVMAWLAFCRASKAEKTS